MFATCWMIDCLITSTGLMIKQTFVDRCILVGIFGGIILIENKKNVDRKINYLNKINLIKRYFIKQLCNEASPKKL